MTTMIDRFFGVPQSVIRLGKLKSLSGIAVKLYVALYHESERYQTRELTRTTKKLTELVGGCRNSHNKARAELIKAGLALVEQTGTDGFIFHLCNPETGKPWSRYPKEKVPYLRKCALPAVHTQESLESKKVSKIDNAGTSFPFGCNEGKCPPAEPLNQEAISPMRWDEIGYN
jgi:hypothetical protein